MAVNRSRRIRTRIMSGVIVVLIGLGIMVVHDWHERTRFPDDQALLDFFQATAMQGPGGGLADTVPFRGPLRLWLPPDVKQGAGGLSAAPLAATLDQALPVLAAITGLDMLRVELEATANVVVEMEDDGKGPDLVVRGRQSAGMTTGATIVVDLGDLLVAHDANCLNRKDTCVGDQQVLDPLRARVLAGLVQALGLSGRAPGMPSVLAGAGWPTAHDLGALALLYHPLVRAAPGPIARLEAAQQVLAEWPEFTRIDDFETWYRVPGHD